LDHRRRSAVAEDGGGDDRRRVVAVEADRNRAGFDGDVEPAASRLSRGKAGGGGEPVALADLSLDRWRQTIDLNLTSTFLTLKTFLPSMAERGRGAVVTVASLAGQHVVPQAKVSASPAYAAAKAGLLMFTRQAAREYAASGIRINAISPGSVMNTRIAGMPEAMLQGLRSSHPLGRIGEPDDVAEAVLYLLSDASSWMTGTTVDINGGFAMR